MKVKVVVNCWRKKKQGDTNRVRSTAEAVYFYMLPVEVQRSLKFSKYYSGSKLRKKRGDKKKSTVKRSTSSINSEGIGGNVGDWQISF